MILLLSLPRGGGVDAFGIVLGYFTGGHSLAGHLLFLFTLLGPVLPVRSLEKIS